MENRRKQKDYFIRVPTWEDGVWTYTEFKTRVTFRDFLLTLFKEPGKYCFDGTSFAFNEQATRFENNNKKYCFYPKGTNDYKKYWNTQKERCRFGAIFKGKENTWYLPGEYYMWLNFLHSFDKVIGDYKFPDIWDSQYHMALFEKLAELHYKHVALLKKRQWGSSLFHMAKAICGIWFEPGYAAKIGASDKSMIDGQGSWKYLEEYRSFLNQHTAWKRPMNPGAFPMWEQKNEREVDGVKSFYGLKGKIQGLTFEKSATKGVGGNVKYFFHEEGGIAPKASETYIYAESALRSGMITTGLFVIAGSVGDLDQCEPLKDFILNPEDNGMYGVETNLVDDEGTAQVCGLFIPEQWSMPPFIDEFGNSDVEGALKALDEEFADLEKKLSPEKYQLKISQRPRNIKEAFAHRKESLFPTHLLKAQQKRIDEKQYPYECLDLERDATGAKIIAKKSNKLPISEFPLSEKTINKEGVLQVWERPIELPKLGEHYYATVDPLNQGKSTTSKSLFSIQILKCAVEVTRETEKGIETFIEPEKLVASWCGRFDDINKTHEYAELIIEWYNAWTICEANVSQFILYMIARKKQHYLVQKGQMTFLKDISANQQSFQEYGWKNVGRIFEDHMLPNVVDYCKEQIDTETKPDGTIVKIKYGVERIPDGMLIKEMLAYKKGLNVDRLVSWAALVTFAKIQQANRGYAKRHEKLDEKLQNSAKNAKLEKGFFKHMGTSSGKGSKDSMSKPSRNAFKNLR